MNEEFNVNNSPEEDWTIAPPDENLPPNHKIIEPIEEWGMTGKLVTPSKKADGWKMPEPKFRNSSGSSPKENDEDLLNPDFPNVPTEVPLNLPPNMPPVSEPAATGFDETPSNTPPEADLPPIAPVSDIEPQPDISEAFVAAEIEAVLPPPKKQRSKAMQIFLMVFGILAMLTFAIVFLVVVYFLFFYKTTVE